MLTAAVGRWKLLPRVLLLALTVLAAIANISAISSQHSSSNDATPSQTTIAFSAALFAGVALLLVALPAAFFRAKLQDAQKRSQLRKVPMALLIARGRIPAGYLPLHVRVLAGFHTAKQVELLILRTIREREMDVMARGVSASAGILSDDLGDARLDANDSGTAHHDHASAQGRKVNPESLRDSD
jgi:hypothetical protein